MQFPTTHANPFTIKPGYINYEHDSCPSVQIIRSNPPLFRQRHPRNTQLPLTPTPTQHLTNLKKTLILRGIQQNFIMPVRLRRRYTDITSHGLQAATPHVHQTKQPRDYPPKNPDRVKITRNREC